MLIGAKRLERNEQPSLTEPNFKKSESLLFMKQKLRIILKLE
jgi:hypothetical protein